MTLLAATLRIYVDAGRTAGKAFARSAWAVVALLLCFPILMAVGMLVAPLGMVGGFIYAFVQAALAGTYLACLKDALNVRRSLSFSTLRANLGAHTWDVIGVLFPLFLLDLVLGIAKAPTVVSVAVNVALFLLLNPVPEMIGRSRASGLELLQEAWRFMMRSGPEWLGIQVVALGAVVFALPGQWLALVSLFGPRFGFTQAGALALGLGGPVGWVIGFLILAAVHLVMLFRAALYERLTDGGRRARAWAEHFR